MDWNKLKAFYEVAINIKVYQKPVANLILANLQLVDRYKI